MIEKELSKKEKKGLTHKFKVDNLEKFAKNVTGY